MSGSTAAHPIIGSQQPSSEWEAPSAEITEDRLVQGPVGLTERESRALMETEGALEATVNRMIDDQTMLLACKVACKAKAAKNKRKTNQLIFHSLIK